MMGDRRKMGPVRQMSLQCEPSSSSPSPTNTHTSTNSNVSKSAQPASRRMMLRKQFSEDIPKARELWNESMKSIRLTASAKNRQKTGVDRPPAAKLAWTEKRQSSLDDRTIGMAKNCEETTLIAKKCKEIKRPTTGKIKRQSSAEKDSILYGPQELADRLRKTLNENQEQGKTNLNIFLAHNTSEKLEDDLEELTDNESCSVPPHFVNNNINSSDDNNSSNNSLVVAIVEKRQPLQEMSPKILSPMLQPENFKNIFQKQIKRTSRARLIFADASSSYTPTPTASKEDARPNLNVIIPVPVSEMTPPAAPSRTMPEPQMPVDKPAQETTEPVEPMPINRPPSVPVAATSASSRREAFQKRANTAFTGSVASGSASASSRPPLVRTLSVPTNTNAGKAPSADHGEKSKFLMRVKRKIKTAKKREKESEDIEFLSELGEDDDYQNNKNKTVKNKMRYVPPSNEVETMVSLVSPSVSDNEEGDKSSVQGSPTKTIKDGSKAGSGEKSAGPKKAAKTVSFQQHAQAVRSFSAGFPYRRHSTVTSLMLGVAPGPPALKNSNSYSTVANQEREKRAPGESPRDDIREAKRRLVRTKSAPFNKSTEDVSSSKQQHTSTAHVKQSSSTASASTNSSNSSIRAMSFNRSSNNSNNNAEADNPDVDQPKTGNGTGGLSAQDESSSSAGGCSSTSSEADATGASDELKFNCEKEKQCWEMYRKMSEKGLTVNYDTLLRGMLTPTEYRLSRKEVPTTC